MWIFAGWSEFHLIWSKEARWSRSVSQGRLKQCYKTLLLYSTMLCFSGWTKDCKDIGLSPLSGISDQGTLLIGTSNEPWLAMAAAMLHTHKQGQAAIGPPAIGPPAKSQLQSAQTKEEKGKEKLFIKLGSLEGKPLYAYQQVFISRDGRMSSTWKLLIVILLCCNQTDENYNKNYVV